MIIMPVPKDIRSFKPKFIGPFTKRQFYSVAAAGCLFAGIYAVASIFNLSMDTICGIGIIVATPILACGFIDMYGLPLWVYVEEIVANRLLAPKYRPYATENVYAGRAKQNKITYEYFDGDLTEYTDKQMKKKKKENKKRLENFYKENPDMVPIE